MNKIAHDGPLDIAVGRSRREIRWANREMLWSALLAKLAETHRTAETLAEYKTAKKERQDEIKDVGGFVGGYINGGRRKAENVMHRLVARGTIDEDVMKALTGKADKQDALMEAIKARIEKYLDR